MTDETDPKRLRLVRALEGLTPKKKAVTPKPAAPGDTTSVRITGNGNIVGSGNVINHLATPRRPRVVVVSEPGVAHITDAQAAQIKALVDEVVQISGELKARPITHQGLWKRYGVAMGVPTYRLTPADQFERAKDWLQRERAILRGMKSAPKKLPNFRASVIGAIHARVREFEGGLARRKGYMVKNFGTDTMTECSDEQLEQLRKHVFGWKR